MIHLEEDAPSREMAVAHIYALRRRMEEIAQRIYDRDAAHRTRGAQWLRRVDGIRPSGGRSITGKSIASTPGVDLSPPEARNSAGGGPS